MARINFVDMETVSDPELSHEHFSERELVDLGCAIGYYLGQRHFVRTLGLS